MNFFSANRIFFYTLGVITALVLFYFFFFGAPGDFPVETIIKIEQGNSLRNVSLKLKSAHIIRSRLAFEAFMILFGREKGSISADYYFDIKLPVWRVAKRISKGEYHMAPITITIPEGFDSIQITDTFASKLPNFDKSKFLKKAKELEGSLFPDTYFFFSTDNEESVLLSINENFNKKIKLIYPDIVALNKATGRTQKEIIIMASIIEREAKGDIDRELIAGILWKRVTMDMPLQVDAFPETYKIKGLPESPISNPGLATIKAAMYPKNSSYLYYLHDKNGIVHYAKNLSEHNRNVRKYLN